MFCRITVHLLIKRDVVEDERKTNSMNTKSFKLPELAFLLVSYNCRPGFVSFHRKQETEEKKREDVFFLASIFFCTLVPNNRNLHVFIPSLFSIFK